MKLKDLVKDPNMKKEEVPAWLTLKDLLPVFKDPLQIYRTNVLPFRINSEAVPAICHGLRILYNYRIIFVRKWTGEILNLGLL